MGFTNDIYVHEVSFDQFERRKQPRVNMHANTFTDSSYRATEDNNMQVVFDLGIEVQEVPFEQFERRKTPRK